MFQHSRNAINSDVCKKKGKDEEYLLQGRKFEADNMMELKKAVNTIKCLIETVLKQIQYTDTVYVEWNLTLKQEHEV